MNKRTIEKILKSGSEYFFVESYYSYWDNMWRENREERKLILILLPPELKQIAAERDINTITLLEVEKFKEAYIDTNIFIFPEYPPFQQFQKPFYNAVDCLPLNSFDLSEILKNRPKNIYELEKLIESFKEPNLV